MVPIHLCGSTEIATEAGPGWIKHHKTPRIMAWNTSYKSVLIPFFEWYPLKSIITGTGPELYVVLSCIQPSSLGMYLHPVPILDCSSFIPLDQWTFWSSPPFCRDSHQIRYHIYIYVKSPQLQPPQAEFYIRSADLIPSLGRAPGRCKCASPSLPPTEAQRHPENWATCCESQSLKSPKVVK
jgi:hypothetical protein